MTKAEHKKLIGILDLWLSSCESFYNTFKKDFANRPDAVKEFEYRYDRVLWLSEFLEECGFISTEKYLEVADRLEKLEIKEIKENEYRRNER